MMSIDIGDVLTIEGSNEIFYVISIDLEKQGVFVYYETYKNKHFTRIHTFLTFEIIDRNLTHEKKMKDIEDLFLL